jgi:FG-GAP-like repeat/FG-GAP repeat
VNGIAQGAGLRYVTETSMPLSFGGYSASYAGSLSPGFHGDDVALGDLDGDGDLDMVVAWHDPLSVSVMGRKSRLQSEADGVSPPVSLDTPRTATRILLNSGSGRFTDVTSAWLPATAAPEFWQADRIALSDLDGDGDRDLVLVSREGLDAYKASELTAVSTSADAGTSTPGDISAAGETDTFTFTAASAGHFVIETTLGTLADSRIELFGPNSSSAFVSRNFDGGQAGGSKLARTLTAGTYYVKVAGQNGTETGTYTLSVRGRANGAFTPSRNRSALRVLENRGATLHFVDVTATAVPALPGGDDDFRGGALLAGDVDGDGRADVVVATTEALHDGSNARVSSTRILLGGPSLRFARAAGYMPDPALDSGEAEDLLLLPGNPGVPQASLVLVSMTQPSASPGGARTRVFDWNR